MFQLPVQLFSKIVIDPKPGTVLGIYTSNEHNGQGL